MDVDGIEKDFKDASKWLCRSLSPFLDLKKLFLVTHALDVRKKHSIHSAKFKKYGKIIRTW